jgi:hypothetical protein
VLKAIKLAAFALLALLILGIGYVCAAALWGITHHRYEMPETGVYYGTVFATLDGPENSFSFLRFRGRTRPRWRWCYPTNFAYRSLNIEWYSSSAKGTGTVSLPSLALESSGSTGVLTRAMLAEWLLGATNGTHSAVDALCVDSIFGYIQAAGSGSLPPPRHHGYSVKAPVRPYIQHFLLGYDVGWPVYIWVPIWLFLVAFFGRRFWSKPN